MLDSLPVELWGKIFSLCCTDGGYTGRCLSLVSQRMMELSYPYKYQSISINNPVQAVLFLRKLQQLVPPWYATTRDLFIGNDWDEGKIEALWDHPALLEDHLHGLDFYYPKTRSFTGHPSVMYQAAILGILAHTQDTLQTLCIISTTATLSYDLFLQPHLSFPLLSELTLLLQRRTTPFHPLSTEVMFPALKRLHIGDYDTEIIKVVKGIIQPGKFEVLRTPLHFHTLRETQKMLPPLNEHLVEADIRDEELLESIDLNDIDEMYRDSRAKVIYQPRRTLTSTRDGWLARQAGGEGNWEYSLVDEEKFIDNWKRYVVAQLGDHSYWDSDD
ncbi:hypothetical protein AX16_002463 [Volvariella volvacea WC 439]|nr:hypothetical protein AX16_002463 [Volvariella volvacea WC 439]